MSTGVAWADCAWHVHGKKDRRLLGVIIADKLLFFCDCYKGTQAELKSRIDNSQKAHKESRTKAMDFVLSCLEETR